MPWPNDLATCLSQICLSWCPRSEFAPPVSVFVCFFCSHLFLSHSYALTNLPSKSLLGLQSLMTLWHSYDRFSKPHHPRWRLWWWSCGFWTRNQYSMVFVMSSNRIFFGLAFRGCFRMTDRTWTGFPTSFGFRGKFWVRNSKALFLGVGSS